MAHEIVMYCERQEVARVDVIDCRLRIGPGGRLALETPRWPRGLCITRHDIVSNDSDGLRVISTGDYDSFLIPPGCVATLPIALAPAEG